jgi:hypothetical protein
MLEPEPSLLRLQYAQPCGRSIHLPVHISCTWSFPRSQQYFNMQWPVKALLAVYTISRPRPVRPRVFIRKFSMNSFNSLIHVLLCRKCLSFNHSLSVSLPTKLNTVAFSPQANYTDRATAACRRS